MVAYTTAPGDLEMGHEERTVVLVERKSSSGWMWKVCIALLLLAVCFGGLLLCAWHWSGRPDMFQMLSGRTEAQIQRELDEAEPHHILKHISSNAKEAIHLEGMHNLGSGNQLEWKKDRGQAFVQGDFRLENNQIIIPKSGLYFVYSQASFRVSCSEEEDTDQRHLSHRIWRFADSVNKNKTLMSAVRSACHDSASENDLGWYTIYLGAVFQLNSGDKLWTETTQLEHLENELGKNFFGLFAL